MRWWLLTGLVLAACGSSDKERNAPLESVGQTTSALTGSTTLAQALSGKIQPVVGAPGNLIAAGTSGEPTVGDDGSASYGVPIWVPNGINGLKPSLSVEYNSEGGIGLLGPRWRLSGLSVITRCAKVRAIDGEQKPIDLYGDVFCLDGERLIRQGTTNDFRPERDTYAKAVGTKDANGAFVSFKVYRRDGLIYHYGRTLDSRLHGNPRLFPPRASAETTYAFYVDKVEDRYSNSILIRYDNPFGSNPGAVVKELVPSTITWGGTGDGGAEDIAGQRSVTFNYLGLPTMQRRWIGGLGIETHLYLETLTIRGPNGQGGTSILKTYEFTYDTRALPGGSQIVTDDRVLSTISECDAAGVCKGPTNIHWEPGSLSHTTVPFNNTTDALITGYGASPSDFSESFTRVLAADIDGDGKDDVVYRGFNSPHHATATINGVVVPYYDCMGWKKRLAAVAWDDPSRIPSLGNATDIVAGSAGNVPLSISASNDFSCDQTRSPHESNWRTHIWGAGKAYVGDMILADLDGDGRTDFLTAVASGQGVHPPMFGSYRAFLNKGNSVGPAINFLDSRGEGLPTAMNYNPRRAAMVAIGDIDGDGAPDILRPTENPALHLRAASVGSSAALTAYTGGWQGFPYSYSECTNASKCNKAIADAVWADGSTAIRDVATVDLDGDGTAEVIRNAPQCYQLPGEPQMCDGFAGVAHVSSPTMSGFMRMVPATAGGAGSARWFLDLNGDGLTDVAWVDPAVPQRIWTSINSGQGFNPSSSFDLPVGARITGAGAKDGGVRIMDFNLDGRQDLLLVVSDTTTGKMPVLLSSGSGSFTVRSSEVAPGWSNAYATHTLVVDTNADGLPDIVNLESNQLVGYIRQGRAPLMVKSITEGSGRMILLTYDVAVDSVAPTAPFYLSMPASTCDQDRKRLECLNKGRWFAKSLSIGGASIPFPTTQTFTYQGGVSDKHGRGFLGFTKRVVHGPGSRRTTITYDPTARVLSGTRYAYPYALLPKTVRVDVDTFEGSYVHHFSTETKTYNASFRSDGTYATALTRTERKAQDCPASSGGVCTGSVRQLSAQDETFAFDTFGNRTSHGITYKNGAGTVLQTDTEATFFAP
ncbi:MAG TPA: FG-GAP-like repeat-containing protein, partial [Polyangiaceae bacterium]